MFIRVLSVSLLLPALVFSTQLMPWYESEFELHTRASYWLQSFQKLDVPRGPSQYRSNDSFLNLSFLVCRKAWCLELEGTTAQTLAHSYGMDNIKLTVRYQWFNDVIDDPFSLTTGLSVDQVFKNARRDIAIFHHGGIEAELHAAIGKEVPCYQFWNSRWWTVGGIGAGDMGYPWLRLDANWEHNWWDRDQLRLFAHSLWGLGHRDLSLRKHFPGYGKIRYQSIDGGLRYSHLFNGEVGLSLEYAYRLYANNCPKNVHFVFVQLYSPFPLPPPLARFLLWVTEIFEK